jgi:GT2 family glycosyltransferase
MTVNQSIRPNSEAGPAEHPQSDWMSADFELGLVSVIVPTYNRANLIEDTLDTVYAHTYRPIELIVIDDGSTYNASVLMSEWADHHNGERFEIRYIHQKNRGAPAARNRGLLESTGEFIQFQESDDVMLSWKIEKQRQILKQNPSAEFVWSEFLWSIDHSEFRNRWRSIEASGLFSKIIMSDDTDIPSVPSQMWAGLFRRSICKKIGPTDINLIHHQDWEYTNRLVSLSVIVAYCSGIAYLCRQHDTGRIDDLNRNPEEAVQARLSTERAAERYLDLFGHLTPAIVFRLANHAFGTFLLALRFGHPGIREKASAEIKRFLPHQSSHRLWLKYKVLALMSKALGNAQAAALHDCAKKITSALIRACRTRRKIRPGQNLTSS